MAALLLLVPVVSVFSADMSTAVFFASSAGIAIFSVGLAAAGCGIALGLVVTAALQGIARQPELTAKLQLNMMIGLAFIESLVLYVLFLAIILLFANPFAKYFVVAG
jgi:F-type H+-transporting ATPase subunit c